MKWNLFFYNFFLNNETTLETAKTSVVIFQKQFPFWFAISLDCDGQVQFWSRHETVLFL